MKMKSNKNKDINIDINIENNLMSKNKSTIKDAKDVPKDNKPKITSGEYMYNQELPRILNDYNSIIASKHLYELSTGRSRPLNMSHIINNPVSQQTAPQTAPQTATQTAPQTATQIVPQTAPETPPDEDSDVFEESQSNIDQDDSDDEEEDPYDFNIVTTEPIESVMIGEKEFEVFNTTQEEEYAQKLKNKNVTKFNTRNGIVRKIKNTPSYKPQINSIMEKKLLGVLKEYRPEKYNAILNGTY